MVHALSRHSLTRCGTWVVAPLLLIASPPVPTRAIAAADPLTSGGSLSIGIARPEDALTFARWEVAGVPRVMAVTGYRDGRVHGIDLSLALGRMITDPIALYLEQGHNALVDVIEGAGDTARVDVDAESLLLPVDLARHHIAAGTNFPEHGDEAGVKDGPFLFAKLVEPTPSRATVSVGSALLDYEVELAWVTLEPLPRGGTPRALGVMLCNDYTDRAVLLHHVDAWDVTSGKGFTTGKSFPGYLPVGDLFVIPRDFRAFAAERELFLYVNDELRQRAFVATQAWDVDRMLDEAWKRADVHWEHGDSTVSLFPEPGVIAPRTLIMSGTPAGTVFRDIATRHKLRGVGKWLAGQWSRSVAELVVESYIADPGERSRFLAAGDRVQIRVDELGVIDNRIVP
jgi:2,4-diketo-3-deoxy-L-fuconate hydrolase